jgi:hypothetical protein
MTLTVRSATVSGATTKGSALTHAELDENFNHLSQSSNHTFTPSGSATSRTVAAKLQGLPRTPQDDGTVDGTADDVQLQAAIDALNSDGGGKLILESNLAIATNVTVKSGVVLDTNGWKITPKTATASLLVNEGAQILTCRMDCTAASVGVAYTGNAIKFTPTQHVNGAKWPNKWIDNAQIEFDIGGGGVGVKMDATSFHIQEMIAGSITVYGGSKAVHLVSGSTASEYCNGNIFLAINAHDSTHSVHEEPSTGDISGNAYHLMAESSTTACEIEVNDAAHITGLLWDRPTVTFNGDNNLILTGNFLMNLGEVTDNGYNNRIETPRFRYQDRRSVSDWGDARVNQASLPGEIAFRDFFDGGKLSDKWVYSGVGTEAAITYGLTESGAGTVQYCKTFATLSTGSSTNDTAQITFGTADVKTGQNPRLHMTVLTGAPAAAENAWFGLWQDANEHILFVKDGGNTRWICRCTVGGVSVDQYIAANFNRLQFLSIICDNSKVRFEHGEAAFGASGIALGRSNMTNSVEETTAANFPVNEEMAPLLYIETTTTAAASLRVYDVQLLRSMLNVVP